MIYGMDAAASPEAMCVAAYNAWAAREKMLSYTGPKVGFEVRPEGNMSNIPPRAERAGCDAPGLINAVLAAQTFPTDVLPAAQLEALNLSVHETIVADWNQDGTDEHLVWLDAMVPPLLFVAEGDHYTLSRPDVRRRNAYTQRMMRATPDGSGHFLVDLVILDHHPYNEEASLYDFMGPMDCGDTSASSRERSYGSVQLWQMVDSALRQMLEAPVCEAASLDGLFSADGRQFFAGSPYVQVFGQPQRVGGIVFEWSDAQQSYVPPALPESTPTATPDVIADKPVDILFGAGGILRMGDYERLLAEVDRALTLGRSDTHPEVIRGLHYYRAMALEGLDHDAEALSEYVALLQGDASSVWTGLAALHVEPIGG
ncbi:MAG: hypothetical protein IPK19_35105 [Chloroflexi bacterium]|nr:hypothetical protein [Chloroflexota bacterium]